MQFKYRFLNSKITKKINSTIINKAFHTHHIKHVSIDLMSRNGLKGAQEHPQGENVVVQRESAHGHHELHFGVLRLVDAHRLDLQREKKGSNEKRKIDSYS